MFYPQYASIKNLAIHKVGNKALDEFYILSDKEIELNDQEKDLLLQHLPKPFMKCNDVFHLFHPSGEIHLNEIYHFINEYFNEQISFNKMSQELAKHLYSSSCHPKIKSGDVVFVHLSNLMMEGEEFDAIAIYKIDTKDVSLKINMFSNGFELNILHDAIDLKNIEKSAIIINKESNKGYTVLVPKISNSFESVSWKNEFLQVLLRDDSYFKTNNILGLTKNFVLDKLDDTFELNNADKADLLNKSLSYFKEHEQFEIEDFAHSVFRNDLAVGLFHDYVSLVQEESNFESLDKFEVSKVAVKSLQKSFKQVLKLDKNFHIYIHGNKELIENGYDEAKGMNYYKLYYQQEM